MKKIIVLTACAAALSAGKPAAVQIIDSNGGYSYVNISTTDISRIHCSAPIKNLIYSKEKRIEIKTSGRDAYIKILPVKRKMSGGEVLRYDTKPRELYLECGDRTYSLILVPKAGRARTIVIRDEGADKKEAKAFEESPYVKTLEELLKAAYREVPPRGYAAVETDGKGPRFKEASLSLIRRYVGFRYVVDTYLLESHRDMVFAESMFGPYLEHPLLISIVKRRLAKGEKSRMFVIRKRAAGSGGE